MLARSLFLDLRALAVGALLACGACAAPAGSAADGEVSEHARTTQQAITNGDDDDADPAVVALLIEGSVYCTGALITRNVILTAAHCVDPAPPDQVFFGSKLTSKKGTLIKVVDSKVHPDFDEATLENDVALVVIESKAPAAPLNVLTADFDASYINRPIRLVGFGVKAGGDQAGLRKRTGDTTILSYGDDDFRFHPGPSQTCNGDSGGPALATFGDHEAIVGLASSGDADCKEYGRNMRVDRYVPFIQSYAKAYSAKLSTPDESSGCSLSTRTPTRGGSAVGALLVLAFAVGARARRASTATCPCRAP